ncbi:DUF5906 domain-containing protein [Paraburkholderia tropica]|uniref:DUF5906 domain-containing protein n=1 Tax=Paraburkholderia tropica TaxID=92647 RepID=UPI0032B4CEC0
MNDDTAAKLRRALAPIVSRVVTTHHWVKRDGNMSHRARPLTEKHLEHHVNGGPACGAAQIAPGAATTLIAALDFDSHQGETPWSDMQEIALTVMRELEAGGLAPIPFRSSGGAGLHIYLLWPTPQDAYSVRAALRAVLLRCGLSDGTRGVSESQVEIFPKQNSVPADGFGNMFILPLAAKSAPLDPFELDDMPKEYAAEMEWPESASVPRLERETPVAPPVGEIPVELEQLRAALAMIPNENGAELDYEEWRNVIFALHHATGGSADGLALAHEFSARSSKYTPAFLDERVWPHIKSSHDGERGAITGRTILKMAREHGWQEPVEDDFEVVETDEDAPKAWHHGWYFLTARDRLAKVGEPGTLSITGFDARFARQMPVGKNGARATAYKTLRDGPGVPTAADQVYAAGQPAVFDFNGLTYLNAYRAVSAPQAASIYTPEGHAAVERVRRHIRLIAGDDEAARMIETWIALNVRHPGRLMGVALLVKGVQGDGKTILFRHLMAALMGAENVGDVANAEVRSQFSGWSVGRALRVVEELKAPGHNRHDVLNSVKPYITNPTISVHRKGQDGFDALNTTNYVCLTNYDDALPIDDTDRRWWVVFSPFSSIADVAALVGDVAAYFDQLADAIRSHPAELRKYFLECELHARIHHNMRAPETEGRARMIQAENDLAGGDFLDGYLADGAYGVSREIIASAELARQLAVDMGDERPQTRKLSALLTSRGFKQCRGTLKWEGRGHRVYVTDARLVDAVGNELGRQRLRKMLDETAKNSESARNDDFAAVNAAADLL